MLLTEDGPSKRVPSSVDIKILAERRKDMAFMTLERRLSNIEANFRMENMPFDDECRERIKAILSGELDSKKALSEIIKQYSVSGNVN